MPKSASLGSRLQSEAKTVGPFSNSNFVIACIIKRAEHDLLKAAYGFNRDRGAERRIVPIIPGASRHCFEGPTVAAALDFNGPTLLEGIAHGREDIMVQAYP